VVIMKIRYVLGAAAVLGALSMAAGCSSSTSGSGSPAPGGKDAGLDAAAEAGGRPANACSDYDLVGKHLLFGDLHVHTRISFDAFLFNANNGPREAYRFAKGGKAFLPCSDANQPCREVKLERPLDFTAVTDHAEFLGGLPAACEGPNPQANCGVVGAFVRQNIRQLIQGNLPVDPNLLGTLLKMPAPATVWQSQQQIANEEYDRCHFTTFSAYEHSPNVSGSMVHRNIVFLGDHLPANVISMFDTVDDWELFDMLKRECGDVAGCDYLTIPHNSNMSDGRMFRATAGSEADAGAGPALAGRGGKATTREDADLQRRSDRLVEITQHKGQSECMAGFGFDGLSGEEVDRDCLFERVKPICTGPDDTHPNCRSAAEVTCTSLTLDPKQSSFPVDCSAPLDYVRNTLAEGLSARRTIGKNPLQYGFVGATDTHNGTPGNVEERTFQGHGGVLDNDPAERMGAWTCKPGNPDCPDRQFDHSAFRYNPGGLTAVWADENSREAIFDALKNRRVYATSGPRISVRLYASLGVLPASACDDLKAGTVAALSRQTTMGGVLPSARAGEKPSFVVWAAQDPGASVAGTPLERIQIIKAWVDGTGARHTHVTDIAGKTDGPEPAADCSITRTGRPEQLCSAWTDPDFDPKSDAVYYARILEQPSCRWNTHECVAKGVTCSALDPATGAFPTASGFDGFEGCCDITTDAGGTFHGKSRFDLIRERAWTSPVWYEP
jgi:hypothetical protein